MVTLTLYVDLKERHVRYLWQNMIMLNSPYAESLHLRYLDDALHTLSPTNERPRVRLEGPLIGLLGHLDEFVWAAIQEPEPPYYIEGRTLKSRRRVFSNDQRSHDLRISPWDSLYGAVTKVPEVWAPNLRFAPHLELLFKTYQEHPISAVGASQGPRGLFAGQRSNAAIFNDFCAVFRRQMIDKKLLSAERNNWGLSGTENLKRLKHYLEDFTDSLPSTTAYHFWLHHTSDLLDLRSATQTQNRASLDALIKCRSTFFNGFDRNRTLFPVKPGYVWSVEPHIQEGWGLRLTLLWSSQVLPSTEIDVNAHAHEIGKYWVALASKGQGKYWLQRIDQNLIGRSFAPSKYHDNLRLQAFMRSLEPLAMRNALVRIRNQPEGKYFGTPQIKRRGPRRSPYFGWKQVLLG